MIFFQQKENAVIRFNYANSFCLCICLNAPLSNLFKIFVMLLNTEIIVIQMTMFFKYEMKFLFFYFQCIGYINGLVSASYFIDFIALHILHS